MLQFQFTLESKEEMGLVVRKVKLDFLMSASVFLQNYLLSLCFSFPIRTTEISVFTLLVTV